MLDMFLCTGFRRCDAAVSASSANFGWSGGNMAALYIREANRIRLARSATAKLIRM
jgi:hypothetical protein